MGPYWVWSLEQGLSLRILSTETIFQALRMDRVTVGVNADKEQVQRLTFAKVNQLWRGP